MSLELGKKPTKEFRYTDDFLMDLLEVLGEADHAETEVELRYLLAKSRCMLASWVSS